MWEEKESDGAAKPGYARPIIGDNYDAPRVCPSIEKSFKCTCAGFGDDGLGALSRGCRSFNRLILSYCGELTDTGVEQIRQLEHLSHLDAVSIELKGVKEDLKVRTKEKTEQLYKQVDGVWTEAESVSKK